MITKNMVVEGYNKGLINLIKSPNGDGIVCSIGDNWFYFGGETASIYDDVEEYKSVTLTSDNINSIYETLEEFFNTGDEFEEEYLYYECFLRENGVYSKEEENMDWKENFYEKLDKEMKEFRESYNSMEVIQIYNDYYIIGFYETIFELLESEYVENDYVEILEWLNTKDKPLEFLYETWMNVEGPFTFGWTENIDWIEEERRKEKDNA